MGVLLKLEHQGVTRLATFSTCGRYRYTLNRIWGDPDRERAAFVLLNPSTADAEKDDPTIRRYIAYARAWGFAGLEILNLFAWRSTDPHNLRMVPDPIGPMNLANIHAVTRSTRTIVCGWGQDAAVTAMGPGRASRQRSPGRWAGTRSALKINADASPAHPRSSSRETSSRSLSPLEPFRSGVSRFFI